MTRYVLMLTITICLWLLLHCSAFAQDYTHPREMNLPAGLFQHPNPIDFQVRLANGLTAYIVEEHTVPLVSLTLTIRAGWASAKKPGTAQVLEQILKSSGSADLNGTAFKTRLQEMSADYQVEVGPELTTLSLNVPAEDGWPAMTLLAGLMIKPDLSGESIRAQMGIVEQKASPSEDATGEGGPVLYEGSLTTAVKQFREVLFDDHAYRAKLTKNDYANITENDVRQFHKTAFVPANAVLAISGDFDSEEARSQLSRHFDSWPQARAPKPRMAAKLRTDRPRRIHTYSADKLQGWIVFGHELPIISTKDETALHVMNCILGGGHFDTRLFRETRDKRGLTNDASGFLEPNWNGPGTYTFRTYGRPEVTHLLVELTLREIDRIRSEPVSEEELFVAQNALADGVFQMKFRNGHTTARTFAEEWLRYRNHNSTATYVERIRSVDAHHVLKAAKKYLHPDRMQMVLVGPVDEIKNASYPEGTTRLTDFGEMVAGK
jgi:predicted Zn-dependent peptidase